MGAGAAVTEHGAGTAREHGGHPTPFGGEGVADRVDALVQAMKPACRHAALDRASPQADRLELTSVDQPVLRGGELADQMVRG